MLQEAVVAEARRKGDSTTVSFQTEELLPYLSRAAEPLVEALLMKALRCAGAAADEGRHVRGAVVTGEVRPGLKEIQAKGAAAAAARQGREDGQRWPGKGLADKKRKRADTFSEQEAHAATNEALRGAFAKSNSRWDAWDTKSWKSPPSLGARVDPPGAPSAGLPKEATTRVDPGSGVSAPSLPPTRLRPRRSTICLADVLRAMEMDPILCKSTLLFKLLNQTLTASIS